MHRLRPTLLTLAGLGMLASSLPHAFAAWPHFALVLAGAEVAPDVIAALGNGWHWGSVAMVAFGAIVLSEAHGAWRCLPLHRATLWPIGLAYAGFGVTAFISRDFNPHYLGFVATGAFVVGALLVPTSGSGASSTS